MHADFLLYHDNVNKDKKKKKKMEKTDFNIWLKPIYS